MVFKTKGFIKSREIKSRRDGILLTVDFNLRNKKCNICSAQSRRDGTLLYSSVVAARLCGCTRSFTVRRLKPPVNKMLSLRDISPITKYCYKILNN